MICICVGARPNFIKAAPIIRELVRQGIPYKLVHTNQHSQGSNMSDCFFDDLGLPHPDIFLESGSFPVDRIANNMQGIYGYLDKIKPSIVVVFGDVDSSLACALAAKKSGFKVAHVEAGERSGNKDMPEEINRILIDEMSDILFFASLKAAERYPGHPYRYLVGNVMIDQLRYDEPKLLDFTTSSEPYAVLTLHRQSNVDNFDTFSQIYKTIQNIADDITIYFPVHPRTSPVLKKAIQKFGWSSNIHSIDPLPRLEFLAMVANAKFVMTDSGGLQIETSYLNVPCITLRNETEWLDTVVNGSNFLTGSTDHGKIFGAIQQILYGGWKQSKFKKMPFYDGCAAKYIVEILKEEIGKCQ